MSEFKKKIAGVGACKHPLGRGKPSREFTIDGVGYTSAMAGLMTGATVQLHNVKTVLRILTQLMMYYSSL